MSLSRADESRARHVGRGVGSRPALEQPGHAARASSAREILHLDDRAVPKSENLPPLEPAPLGVEPVVSHADAVAVRANLVHLEVAIAGSLTPLDPSFENRPGLVDASS